MSEEKKEGWICPNCNVVNAPDVKQCNCVVKEDKDHRNLLLE